MTAADQNDILRRNAEAAKERVIKQVETAFAAIRRDIAKHDGIYPANRGRVTLREVARRAGVDISTLWGAAHKASTLPRVRAFVDEITRERDAKSTKPGEPYRHRKAIAESITAWKEAFEKIAQEYHEAELELTHAREQVADRDRTITTLSAQIDELRTHAYDNVLPISGYDKNTRKRGK